MEENRQPALPESGKRNRRSSRNGNRNPVVLSEGRRPESKDAVRSRSPSNGTAARIRIGIRTGIGIRIGTATPVARAPTAVARVPIPVIRSPTPAA